MKLNHLNLTVTDPMETHDFLAKYFGLRSMGGNKNMAFLSDDDGAVISLTSLKVARETEVRYPASFHVGFIQPSHDAVDALNQRLKEDGYAVPPPSSQHGSWTFYFEAPGGFVIEVLA
jgi:lactoylglutathione lyase